MTGNVKPGDEAKGFGSCPTGNGGQAVSGSALRWNGPVRADLSRVKRSHLIPSSIDSAAQLPSVTLGQADMNRCTASKPLSERAVFS